MPCTVRFHRQKLIPKFFFLLITGLVLFYTLNVIGWLKSHKAETTNGSHGYTYFKGEYIISDTHTELCDDRRPWRTLPVGFSIRPSSIPKAGLGVWTDIEIPAKTRIGPYEGIIAEELDDYKYAWNVYDKAANFLFYVDAFHKNSSNWLRYINAAKTIDEENMYVHQLDNKIYYVTYENVKPGTELLTWYGPDYGKSLGLKRSWKDYQRKFGLYGNTFVIENTISDTTSLLYEHCYKFYDNKPFEFPPLNNSKVDRHCLYDDDGFQVCKYRPCKLNPCTQQVDCQSCKGYCFYHGMYYKVGSKFPHTDYVNRCQCSGNGHSECTDKLHSIYDFCSFM